MARIELERVTKAYDGHATVHGRRSRHRGWRVRRAGRALRLRQVDDAAHDRRARRHHAAGTIRIGGKVVNDAPARDRDIAMVFQNYALYPHMTCTTTWPSACAARSCRREEIDARVGWPPAPCIDAPARPQAGAALRRPAAARRHGPRDRARPRGVSVRRAAVEPRCRCCGSRCGSR